MARYVHHPVIVLAAEAHLLLLARSMNLKITLQSLRYLAISLLLILSASAQQNTLSTNPNGLLYVGGTIGIGPTPFNLTVTSSPNPNLPITITTSASWLFVSGQAPGSTPAAVQFGLNANDKSIPGPGVYQATATISSPSAASTTVVFIFTVNSPTPLSNSPGNLQFSYTAGGALPAAQPLNINASVAIPYSAAVSASWLVLGAGSTSGTTPGTITVGVDPSKLTPSNSYVGSVTVTPTNGLPGLVVPVVFLYFPSPQLTVSPSALTFNYQIG